jgi:hypothetical protein
MYLQNTAEPIFATWQAGLACRVSGFDPRPGTGGDRLNAYNLHSARTHWISAAEFVTVAELKAIKREVWG